MNSDTFAEIRFKTEFARDCVLIAFEPDKRHLNFLIDEIYGKRTIDDKHPVKNMCLITTEKLEKTGGNIINICLPERDNLNKIDDYFKFDESCEIKIDMLMDSIYYYIEVLSSNLATNKDYINEKFSEYINDQWMPNGMGIDPEEAEEAATLLSFAYWLYISEYYQNSYSELKNDITFEILKKQYPIDVK